MPTINLPPCEKGIKGARETGKAHCEATESLNYLCGEKGSRSCDFVAN